MTVCCRNREVPETGTLRGVGGEAFLPYPIVSYKAIRTASEETRREVFFLFRLQAANWQGGVSHAAEERNKRKWEN